MKTSTFESVKTPEAIAKCLKYANGPSDNKEENEKKLQELIDQIEISVRFDGIRKYFTEDEEERLTGTFKIERNKRSIEFEYGFSIADTQKLTKTVETGGELYKKTQFKKEFKEDLLYSCLSCCGMDYNTPKSFQYFCDEYGYNRDSIKHKALWEKCLEQSAKLERIFTEEEVQHLPS